MALGAAYEFVTPGSLASWSGLFSAHSLLPNGRCFGITASVFPSVHLSLLFHYCIKNGRPTSIIIWRKCQLLALTDLIALTPVDWVTVGSLVCHRVGKCSYVKRKRQKLEGLPKYIYILIPLLQCLHLHNPHLKFHLIC